MLNRLTAILLLSAYAFVIAHAHAQLPVFASNMARIDGTEPSSGIVYTRLFIGEQPAAAPTAADAIGGQTLDLSRPILTAECTRRHDGKYFFDLFVNFGGVTDTAYYAPWKPANDSDLFPPSTAKTIVTLEFLGYTKYKPVKAQFEFVVSPQNQMRYNSPSLQSKNLEPITFYLQVLRALPTLKVTTDGHVASFFMTPLLTQLHAEPLCRASGL